MQLEYICDMELVYREESLYADKFLLVRPYGERGRHRVWGRRWDRDGSPDSGIVTLGEPPASPE